MQTKEAARRLKDLYLRYDIILEYCTRAEEKARAREILTNIKYIDRRIEAAKKGKAKRLEHIRRPINSAHNALTNLYRDIKAAEHREEVKDVDRLLDLITLYSLKE